MEFLCPHCQNKLMVQDQYAGTLMKCPYCSKNFQAPAQAPALPPVPPPPPPVSSPPPVTTGNSSPLPSKTPPLPDVLPVPKEKAATRPVSAPLTSTEYAHTHALTLSPRVLPWVAVGAWVLVFILFFFPWVGLFPGGLGVYTQGPLSVAVGGAWSDPNWSSYVRTADNTVSGFMLAPPKGEGKPEPVLPNGSILLGLFIFFFFWVALLTTIVAAVWPLVRVGVPPALEQLRPWRWAIAGGLSVVAFFLLLFQILAGFSLEYTVNQRAEAVVREKYADQQQSFKELAVAERVSAVNPERTLALWLAFWISLLATVAAGLQFWIDHRGDRPLPQLAVHW